MRKLGTATDPFSMSGRARPSGLNYMPLQGQNQQAQTAGPAPQAPQAVPATAAGVAQAWQQGGQLPPLYNPGQGPVTRLVPYRSPIRPSTAMPQPMSQNQVGAYPKMAHYKQSYLGLRIPTALGLGYGAGRAPDGEKLRGSLQGALAGAGLGLGSNFGGLATGILASRKGSNPKASLIASILGAIGGGAVGYGGAKGLGRAVFGKFKDRKYDLSDKDEAVLTNIIADRLLSQKQASLTGLGALIGGAYGAGRAPDGDKIRSAVGGAIGGGGLGLGADLGARLGAGLISSDANSPWRLLTGAMGAGVGGFLGHRAGSGLARLLLGRPRDRKKDISRDEEERAVQTISEKQSADYSNDLRSTLPNNWSDVLEPLPDDGPVEAPAYDPFESDDLPVEAPAPDEEPVEAPPVDQGVPNVRPVGNIRPNFKIQWGNRARQQFGPNVSEDDPAFQEYQKRPHQVPVPQPQPQPQQQQQDPQTGLFANNVGVYDSQINWIKERLPGLTGANRDRALRNIARLEGLNTTPDASLGASPQAIQRQQMHRQMALQKSQQQAAGLPQTAMHNSYAQTKHLYPQPPAQEAPPQQQTAAAQGPRMPSATGFGAGYSSAPTGVVGGPAQRPKSHYSPPVSPFSKLSEEITPFAAGFLARCFEEGFDTEQIAERVKVACELDPAISEEFIHVDNACIEKQAGLWDLIRRGAGFVGKGISKLIGSGAPGAAKGMAPTRTWVPEIFQSARNMWRGTDTPITQSRFTQLWNSPMMQPIRGAGTGYITGSGADLLAGMAGYDTDFGTTGMVLGALTRNPFARRLSAYLRRQAPALAESSPLKARLARGASKGIQRAQEFFTLPYGVKGSGGRSIRVAQREGLIVPKSGVRVGADSPVHGLGSAVASRSAGPRRFIHNVLDIGGLGALGLDVISGMSEGRLEQTLTNMAEQHGFDSAEDMLQTASQLASSPFMPAIVALNKGDIAGALSHGWGALDSSTKAWLLGGGAALIGSLVAGSTGNSNLATLLGAGGLGSLAYGGYKALGGMRGGGLPFAAGNQLEVSTGAALDNLAEQLRDMPPDALPQLFEHPEFATIAQKLGMSTAQLQQALQSRMSS